MSCHRTKHKFRNYFIKLREAKEKIMKRSVLIVVVAIVVILVLTGVAPYLYR
jgi:capsular polysaccharide biosynthesis protein